MSWSSIQLVAVVPPPTSRPGYGLGDRVGRRRAVVRVQRRVDAEAGDLRAVVVVASEQDRELIGGDVQVARVAAQAGGVRRFATASSIAVRATDPFDPQ